MIIFLLHLNIEEGVDEESFMLLDDMSIAALITATALRVKFKKFHSELLEVSLY